jgi:predicted NUDIX family NTP pyrophosphohydrolase
LARREARSRRSPQIGRLFAAVKIMNSKQSAGILLYRRKTGTLQVFLVHPGGPFWKNKDAGVWTIPKGEFTNDEPALDAAIREFREETGHGLRGPFQPLSPIRQKGGKRVYAWASPGDLDASGIVSNTVEIEWPRRSGKILTYPEVDKGGWFTLEDARRFINPAQVALLEELDETLNGAA